MLSLFSLALYAEESGEVMQKIWSPYCKGVSLLECPSSKAETLRAEIRQRMGSGETFESVFADLSQRYGPSLRMAPETSGREGLAYWLPYILFGFIAVGVVIFWIRRGRQPKKAASPLRSIQNPQIESQILKDLEERINS